LLSGLPVTDLAGTIFHPAHFRARGGLTLSGKNFSLSAFLNHSGAVTDNRRPASVKIEGATTIDLTGRIKLAKGTEVALSAQNLFNSKPAPIFTTSPFDTPFDTTNGSAIARFLSVTVRHDW
ncbi:MAG: TonB-dependent receptor, partial [Sphingopyxis sp.]